METISLPIVTLTGQVLQVLNMKTKIELPQIIVIGEQSAGKSSVLESVAGFEMLLMKWYWIIKYIQIIRKRLGLNYPIINK